MFKIAGIWGACAGVLYIALTWVSLAKRQELNTFPAWGLLSTALYIIILGVFIFIAMRNARSKFYSTIGINYAQTLYIGVLTAVITGFIAGIFAFSYIQFVEPDFGSKLIIEMTAEMTKHKLPAKDIAEMTTQLKTSYTPPNQFMSLLIGTTIMGIICSSLLAIFVRNRDTFTSNQ
ncbi:MAG: hypothetical protein JWO58_1531 [Chitinophagaceae bacterium]|nr:hypothetical protein [Chitinophagaceae bacterium]